MSIFERFVPILSERGEFDSAAIRGNERSAIGQVSAETLRQLAIARNLPAPNTATFPSAVATATTTNNIPQSVLNDDYETVKTPNPNTGVQTVSADIVGTVLPSFVQTEIAQTGLVSQPQMTLASDQFAINQGVRFDPTGQGVALQSLSSSAQAQNQDSAAEQVTTYVKNNKALVLGVVLILGVGWFSARAT